MDQIVSLLNKRLAGIPAWVWGVVIGGGIALYAYLNRGEEGPSVAAETVPYVDDFAPGDAGDISGIPEVEDNSGDIPIETNPAWIRHVSDRMRVDGEDPVLVQNALTKVLGGIEVTAAEAAMYALIVRRFGPPPEGAPPVKTAPGNGNGNGQQDPKPSTPKDLTAWVTRRYKSEGSSRVNVAFRWDTIPSAAHYEARRVYPGTSGIQKTHTNRYQFTDLTAGPVYRFEVRAVTSGGRTGNWSEVQINT